MDDLGGIGVAGNRVVKPGLLYRGSALSGATEHDCEVLFGQLHIGCVVDVRCGWERREKPDVAVPGVNNLHIPFYDQDIVGIEYTEPAEGTKTIGRDAACNPDHFYRSLSNPLTVGQMRRGIRTLFGRAMDGCPTYVHCSGGKDRAGIMALLVLTVLGADNEAILDDYLLTNVSRDRHYEETFARFLRFSQGDADLARELVESHSARPQNLAAFYEAIADAYGTMDSFVRTQLGIDADEQVRIRECCTMAA